ncbi:MULTISPECIES: L-fuculose-phosphate aldolase [Clostridia]|uniref:L-fuculose-phosphate aldolase n=1 Tax=Clostridia TaxID=186801 RepID=UPI000EA0A8EF|nr:MULTISPECIES: L-fuculose-phosphate aldolase [Clostridia]NBJ68092.1 L-fuculose-phosphate aldolase [Roseburia sp. 1XD42-34]RKI81868.1 L-fuculose-phosphate aldolase [Clostridium sp. 1xD42-85]
MKYLKEERKQIVEYGKKLIDSGLTVGTGGNISIFDKDSGLMGITPSGIEYHNLTEEDVIIMDLYGNVVEGELRPSSEHQMHSIVYKNRYDAVAMIHMHALYSTTISCLNVDLPAIDYLVAHSGGKNIRCANYATYGTNELAENALEAMKDRKAVLLANHGINVVGSSLAEAYAITEQLEFCARLYWQAKAIGNPVILSDEEMTMMVERFKDYGQPKDAEK